jgi:hypothetical protein
MVVMTLICGTWNVWHFLAVIRAGGVGKNGSTVAVSLKLQISISNSKTIFFWEYLYRLFHVKTLYRSIQLSNGSENLRFLFGLKTFLLNKILKKYYEIFVQKNDFDITENHIPVKKKLYLAIKRYRIEKFNKIMYRSCLV